MDDIKAIRDALQEPWAYPDRSADAEVQRLYRLCQRADDAIARLLDALELAQKDAERYRWLRTFNVDSYMACGKLNDLDTEIDAAMAASPPQSPAADQSAP